ncbi:hypothetical protein Mapa_005845 [Marchantia paleacea]|nr:hypothetical protein Mapa_005845 [Marchantia paleacea]
MKRQVSGIMRFLKIRVNGASSPGIRKVKPQSPLRHRYWPLSYFFGILLCLILFSLLVHKVTLQKEEMLHARTVFGDNLLPTPWHWHDNPLGPQAFTWERSVDIKKCSFHSWIPTFPRTLGSLEARPTNSSCPQFFEWIRSDLAPWKETGITMRNVEGTKDYAAFRVTIVKGRLYLDVYYSCVQTRALFTVWGILLLLEKYKGLVPDVDLMFDCMDRPRISRTETYSDFESAPVLFRYCSTKSHYDIPFPDWSFWGWSETKLEPWDQQREKIVKASAATSWKSKTRKAFWRGNPDVGSPLRMELLKCNNASGWHASRSEIQNQNWEDERTDGTENLKSKLENQCKHRYKIYAEGFAWSVSFKYIMACGSPTLAISPKYHDFFSRGLQSYVHYMPVRPSEICASKLCPSIKTAVDWAESNPKKAMAIGKAGQEFLRRDLSMNNVYDYMFHLISEYAGLQTYKPLVPETAEEITQNFIMCLAQPQLGSLLQKTREAMIVGTIPCHVSNPKKDSFQQNDWEAREHEQVDWSEKQCSSR